MDRKRISFYLMLMLFFIISACSKAPYYEKTYSFKDRIWSLDVKPEFVVDINDISKLYTFELAIRTTTNYKYNNLWIFLRTEAPDGSVSREAFELKITDEFGNWLGEKTGTIVETKLRFKERKLPLKGVYKFKVEQAVTLSKVDEVLDIRFKVEEKER